MLSQGIMVMACGHMEGREGLKMPKVVLLAFTKLNKAEKYTEQHLMYIKLR